MPQSTPPRFVAVIGDMVDSRALSPSARNAAQKSFVRLVALLNRRFRQAIASQFVITLGDEFQGLLRDAAIIPELVWLIEGEYRQRDIRLGIGYGTLFTPLRRIALNIDGPAFHHARAAITVARKRKFLGGVFDGFGAYDDVLTGYAQVLRYVRGNMTPRQRRVFEILRSGRTRQQAAQTLRISKQAVSRHAIAAGWDSYRLAEIGWARALRLATRDDTNERLT